MDNNYLMEWARRATEAYRRTSRQIKGSVIQANRTAPRLPADKMFQSYRNTMMGAANAVGFNTQNQPQWMKDAGKAYKAASRKVKRTIFGGGN